MRHPNVGTGQTISIFIRTGENKNNSSSHSLSLLALAHFCFSQDSLLIHFSALIHLWIIVHCQFWEEQNNNKINEQDQTKPEEAAAFWS